MAKPEKKTVTGRVLHDPVKDKLRPIFPLDLSKCRTVDELVRAMGDTAFTARQIGDAADVFEVMARDKECFVVMTLSGALTVGKMGLVFCDLIESGVVNAIVSTGALMAHGLVEATGHSHFRYNPKMGDSELFQAGYNRVYDSLEPEVNLDHVEEVMDHVLAECYAELLARRGYQKLPLKRYNYGVRICPEPVHWGGLSGSTYTEAVSWGKFVPPEEGGQFAEVFDDATVALPLVAGAVLERLGYFGKNRSAGATK